MKIKIFYFTGTGNTLKLARDLKKELGDVDLIKVSYNMDFEQTDTDIAGIAYPVYCFGIPNVISNFINKVKLNNDAYIFGLASYGGLLTGSGKLLKKELKKRGYRLNAGFAIKMPGNATIYYNIPALEKREKMFAFEAERIKQIAAAVRDRKEYKVETNLGLFGQLISAASNKMMSKINETAKSFFVDEKCNGCGNCVNICPVQNIKLKDNKPVWFNKCEGCLACFHWCPQASIQSSAKTRDRDRYHHPDISYKAML
ncbi:MAG: 4Fe-4S ferredoxin [bacterium]|nr:4Fe-4S ferredoxin [bacterium]